MSDSDDPSNHLKCCICKDFYKDPRILPCGHSFCTSCLKKLLEIRDPGQPNCPICRSKMSLDSVVTHYPVVFDLKSVTDAHQKSKNDIDQCAIHGKPKKYFCESSLCMCFLCEECWLTDHNKHAVVLSECRIHEVLISLEPHFQSAQESLNLLEDKIAKVVPDQTTVTSSALVTAFREGYSVTTEKAFQSFQSNLLNKEMQELIEHVAKLRLELRNIDAMCNETEKKIRELSASLENSLFKDQEGGRQTTFEDGFNQRLQCANVSSVEITKLSPNCSSEIAASSIIDVNHVLKEITYAYGTTITTVDYCLREQHRFEFTKGVIKDIAVDGKSGLLYILYVSNGYFCLVAKNRENDEEHKLNEKIGELHKDTDGHVFVETDRILVIKSVPYQPITALIIHDGKSCSSRVTLGPNIKKSDSVSYMLPCKGHLTEISQDSITVKSGPFYKSSAKKILLKDLKTLRKLAWTSISCENPSNGYLLASEIGSNNRVEPRIYDMDLTKLEQGQTLEPLDIPFFKSVSFRNFNFIVGLGNGSALCACYENSELSYFCRIKMIRNDTLFANDSK